MSSVKKGSIVEQPAAAPRPPVQIDPARVTLNHAGFAWSSYSVRLPEGVTMQDLNDQPEMWGYVQSGRAGGLRVMDEVRVIGWDQTWMATAIVSEASSKGLTLAGLRRIELPARTMALPNDGVYRVVWNGAGYAVQRIRDGLEMVKAIATVGSAELAMRRLHPERVT